MSCTQRIRAAMNLCSLWIIVAEHLALANPYTPGNTTVITIDYISVFTIVNTNINTGVITGVMAAVGTGVNQSSEFKYNRVVPASAGTHYLHFELCTLNF